MPRRTRLTVAFLLLTAQVVACRDAERTHRARSDEHAKAPEPSEPAAPVELGEVESLATSLARDESTEACLAHERARLSSAASEALTDLGYDRFLEDVCASAHALATKDADACSLVSLESLRSACVTRVAIAAADPAVCPRAGLARDPLCVAFASGDETLCVAAAPPLVVRCHAVLKNDRRACREATELHRAECDALVRRLGSVVAPRRHASASIAPTWEGQATVVTHDGVRETPIALPPPDLAHGVVLRTTGCTTELVVGDSREPRVLRLGREMPTHLVTAFPASSEAPFTRPIDRTTRFRFEPRALEPIANAFDTQGTVELLALEPSRGGRVELRLRASFPIGESSLETTMHLVSFVRDLDAIDPSCANSPRPEGGTTSTTRRRASPRAASRTTLRSP